MSLVLYLVQHGLAESEDVNPERPLSKEGTEETALLAEFFATKEIIIGNENQNLTPTTATSPSTAPLQFWHSGKLRARQTAEILAEKTAERKLEAVVAEKDGLNPKDSADAFFENNLLPLLAGETEQSSSVVICGHLPFLQELAATMVSHGGTTGSNVGEQASSAQVPKFSNSCLFRFDGSKGEDKFKLAFAENVSEMRAELVG
ncbi:unnamed protein product [Amoebophrya sp. A120]|nr:unnamed protein product [Amoebophrya sp. A120]|eukprot:GSA120T00017764001.1